MQAKVNQIIDEIGVLSSNSQGLPSVITTSLKFFGSDNRVYLKVEGNKVIGLLRVGRKKLFIRDEAGGVKEIEPVCVLDFYVYQSCQRSGFGKQLFEFMLDDQRTEPHYLAYDKPTEKFLSFLSKHYGLKTFVPQVNNFVIFTNYFWNDPTY